MDKNVNTFMYLASKCETPIMGEFIIIGSWGLYLIVPSILPQYSHPQ